MTKKPCDFSRKMGTLSILKSLFQFRDSCNLCHHLDCDYAVNQNDNLYKSMGSEQSFVTSILMFSTILAAEYLL